MDKNKVYIFDTTLRDGEQAPGYSMNLDEKIKMALQLEKLGVDIIEAGFAISSPQDAKSVEEIAKAIKNAQVASLARCVKKDIDAAWQAVKNAKNPRIHVFLATSDIHLEYKLKLTREEALSKIKENVAYAYSLCKNIEFSLEDATRTDLDYMCKVVECAINAGATTINLPDTVGYSTPNEIANMVETVKKRVANIDKAIISMHCHNDLGLAVANTLAGINAGARQVECTICGIGERAGNAAMEEIVMALKTRSDVFKNARTDINTKEIYNSAHLLSSITGVKIFPSKAIVGKNAFAHESGIHQHGMLANSQTYEIMTPESVGVQKTNLVLGKHSGQHAFESKLEELGYKLEKSEYDKLFVEFKNLCDRKKDITTKDIVALLDARDNLNTSIWSCVSFTINTGNNMTSTALLKMKNGDVVKEEVAIGSGPIYAAFKAIEKIINHHYNLDDYQLSAVTEHRDALGEVYVKISDESGSYRGRGVSTDIIEASITACINAVNKMLSN